MNPSDKLTISLMRREGLAWKPKGFSCFCGKHGGGDARWISLPHSGCFHLRCPVKEKLIYHFTIFVLHNSKINQLWVSERKNVSKPRCAGDLQQPPVATKMNHSFVLLCYLYYVFSLKEVEGFAFKSHAYCCFDDVKDRQQNTRYESNVGQVVFLSMQSWHSFMKH